MSIDKNIGKVPKIEKKKKYGYNPTYYYFNKLLSYSPKDFFFYVCIGSRGRGKTVSAWRWVLKRYMKYGETFIWLRLTEAPLKKAARSQGKTLAPKFILDRLGIVELTMKGSVIYATFKQDGKLVTRECGIMDAISTYYTSKGQHMGEYTNVVFDEINREVGEKNTFQVVRAFINQIETIARMRHIRVIMLGNTISDTSDILGIFNFQPKEFGIYKLKRYACIIEYLDDNEEFKEARKNSLAGKLLGQGDGDVSASFTNKMESKVDNLLKYDHTMKQIFTIYIGEYKEYGIFTMKNREGYYVGDSRVSNVQVYKLSPFMTSEGVYNDEIYKSFYELISMNKLTYETAMVRARFIKALKSNRTSTT